MTKKAEKIYKDVGPKKAFGHPDVIKAMKAVCPACNGTGKHNCNCELCDEELCTECDGTGEPQ